MAIGIAAWGLVAGVALAKSGMGVPLAIFMSIVVIAGSGVMEARNIPPGAAPFTFPLLLAFLAAMISGFLAIRWLVALLKHRKFHLFAPYCAILGLVCLVWYGWLGK